MVRACQLFFDFRLRMSNGSIVDEMNIATIPTELIELICSWAVESAFEESELREAAGKSLSREDSVLCSTLSRLPLIHPRWTVAGQGALYRYVKLWTADRCKAFQDSLTMYPNNGIHVRAIMIHWGEADFGGPDGYAYKVLGWFHEMEIQHLIRLCPRLQRFESREAASALHRRSPSRRSRF